MNGIKLCLKKKLPLKATTTTESGTISTITEHSIDQINIVTQIVYDYIWSFSDEKREAEQTKPITITNTNNNSNNTIMNGCETAHELN